MSEDKSKKYQAAIAGVMMYLEEEMKKQADSQIPEYTQSAWALNGRQTIMSNRSMMQFRLKKR